ncbi:MAG TPA: carbohydrate-binding protein, partial [Polyangia bacterium]|nr:carbohydrate-binding protein [Polyangia bacterium]
MSFNRPSVFRRTTRSAARLIAAAGLVLAAGQGARAASTITVDASKQSPAPAPFWAASVGTGTASLTLRSDLETHYKIGNREAGFQRVRGHGVLDDDVGIYKGPGSYDWTNFDKYLAAIVAAGMRPVMELDFMPTALALHGNSRDTYSSVSNYKAFIQAVVQHCVDKYGATDVGQWYWEVWNEPDYSGFWNGTNSSEATSAKMTDYYALYDAAVGAITAVLPNALVGGPATTGYGPVGAFLQHCKTAGTRVTFASSHYYPGGAAGGTSADAAGMVNDNNSRISQITTGGFTTATVASFNTEWNSSYSGQGGGTGDVLTSMDNNWNVGFILKAVKLLADQSSGSTPPIGLFSYWVLSDVFGEYSGDAGSYIQTKGGGTLPFGQVFGLITYQGVRKAAFNAFKMLHYLGPTRLAASGGTTGDGVDALATMSAAGDEIEIVAYDYDKTLNTTGTDSVTVTVNNLPPGLAGKQVFVTQFVVDATHSNPYSVWTGQGKPTNPTEAQWQAMKAAQHLALLQPVSTTTLETSYTTTFTMNRQSGTLLVLGVKRPVTGRNGLGTIEGEDYDGQSGASKVDSNDTDLGQAITASSGGYVFYDVVDFSDAGVGSVQLRVNAQSATTVELHADSQSGALLGKCAVPATSGWATASCALTPISGVHTLYVGFDGAVNLNWLLFQQASTGTGSGGAGGGGASGTGGGAAGAGTGG